MCLPEPELSRIGNSAFVDLFTNETNTLNLVGDNPSKGKCFPTFAMSDLVLPWRILNPDAQAR
jgi:hypothetical protein